MNFIFKYRRNKIDIQKIKLILSNLETKKISLNEAFDELRDLPYEDLGFAKIDHHRSLRKDFPEVIFGEGKTVEQITSIVEKQISRNDIVLVTRTTKDAYKSIKNNVEKSRCNKNTVKIRGSKFLQNLHFAKMMRHVKVCHM